MDVDDQKKKKSEHKHMRDDDERLKSLETCEVLVCSVLEFDMDHINNLKVKDIRVLLSYQFWSEKSNGILQKVELVEAVKCFRKYWAGLVHRWGSAVSIIKK